MSNRPRRGGAKYEVGHVVDREEDYDNPSDVKEDAERDMIHESEEEMSGSKLASMSLSGPKNTKLPAALVARAFLPNPEDIKQCMVYTDLAIKMQMIVFDLSSSLWWTTMAEFLIFFPFSFFVFCLDPEHMGFIWLFAPHILRGLVALLILKRMPTTHDMVMKINIKENEPIPFSNIKKFVVTGATESVDEFQSKAGKWMLLYAILTVVALALDVIVIFIGVGGMNNDSAAFGTVFILILGVLYFLLATFFIGWVFSVRMRLPDYAKT